MIIMNNHVVFSCPSLSFMLSFSPSRNGDKLKSKQNKIIKWQCWDQSNKTITKNKSRSWKISRFDGKNCLVGCNWNRWLKTRLLNEVPLRDCLMLIYWLIGVANSSAIAIGIGIGIGIFNDNVVNNYTRLRCEEKARMHLNTRGGCEESHSNKNSQKQNRLLSFDHDPKFG